MPLRITYWTASRYNPNVPGAVISSEVRTISGTSAQSGATPPNAVFVSIRNTETGDVNYNYSSATSVATADVSTPGDGGIGTGERLWFDAVPSYKVAGITSS